ncbi:MAG: hypothetical protein II751_05090, partial [Bacteroidales bacterium]|nr:hypothetical protein [Bacteroidales bacterium]
KLFDYIQAGVPIVASHLVEIEKIIRQYDLGLFIDEHTTECIARTVREALADEGRRRQWKANLKQAAAELCWENEDQNLLDFIQEK